MTKRYEEDCALLKRHDEETKRWHDEETKRWANAPAKENEE